MMILLTRTPILTFRKSKFKLPCQKRPVKISANFGDINIKDLDWINKVKLVLFVNQNNADELILRLI